MMNGLNVFGIVVFALLAASTNLAADPKLESVFPKIKIQIVLEDGTFASWTGRTIIANTNARRAKGLMFRKTMRVDESMTFTYPRTGSLSFWMKNTYTPLSAIGVDRNCRIVSHRYLEPENETPVELGPGVMVIELARQKWPEFSNGHFGTVSIANWPKNNCIDTSAE